MFEWAWLMEAVFKKKKKKDLGDLKQKHCLLESSGKDFFFIFFFCLSEKCFSNDELC